MIEGKLVRLRAVEPADYPMLHRWLNDSEITYYWGKPGNTLSLHEVARREEEQASRGNSRKYIIETHAGEPIGQVDYYDLDWKARSAWTSIMIGEPDHQGGGYGTDAMRILLGFLFREYALHRVTLTVHETNERAIRSYEKNGFVKEGVLRDWTFFDGRWVNGLVMAVLESEFKALADHPPSL